MKGSINPGTLGVLNFQVTQQHVIDFADEVMPEVLSTPWLVWFLEHAAREAVIPYLENHESTVGVQVSIEHLAPTPVGHHVRCEAKVFSCEGQLISFGFQAYDQDELIARGSHKMRVIEAARLKSRVDKKRS